MGARARALLALFGRRTFESDEDEIEAVAGALALASGLSELETIREVLIKKP